ncbi:MAG: hypothetical protein ABIG93_02975 [archaeon]|nr:hypothetical protein [Nanoarchaeota archaeon]
MQLKNYEDFLRAALEAKPGLTVKVELITFPQGGGGYSGEKVFTISEGRETLNKYVVEGLNLDDYRAVDETERETEFELTRDLANLENAIKKEEERKAAHRKGIEDACRTDLIAAGEQYFDGFTGEDAYRALTDEDM